MLTVARLGSRSSCVGSNSPADHAHGRGSSDFPAGLFQRIVERGEEIPAFPFQPVFQIFPFPAQRLDLLTDFPEPLFEHQDLVGKFHRREHHDVQVVRRSPRPLAFSVPARRAMCSSDRSVRTVKAYPAILTSTRFPILSHSIIPPRLYNSMVSRRERSLSTRSFPSPRSRDSSASFRFRSRTSPSFRASSVARLSFSFFSADTTCTRSLIFFSINANDSSPIPASP